MKNVNGSLMSDQETTRPRRHAPGLATAGRASRAAFALLLMGVASSSFAAEKGDFILRFGVQYASPTGATIGEYSGQEVFDDPSNPPNGTFDIVQIIESDPKSAYTASLGFEYMVSDSFGIDCNLSSSRHDFNLVYSGEVTWTPMSDPEAWESAEIEGGQPGEIRMTPLTVGANYHLRLGDRVDVYFGPLVGYVFYGDISLEAGEFQIEFSEFTSHTPLDEANVNVDNDFAVGAALGIDVAAGESWTFSASARYLRSSIKVDEDDGPPAIDFDPLLVQVGVGYRF